MIETNVKLKAKICGLTRREDIAAANELLPDYIGKVLKIAPLRKNNSVLVHCLKFLVVCVHFLKCVVQFRGKRHVFGKVVHKWRYLRAEGSVPFAICTTIVYHAMPWLIPDHIILAEGKLEAVSGQNCHNRLRKLTI